MSDSWVVRIERYAKWGPFRYCIMFSHGWKRTPMEFAFTLRGAKRKARRTAAWYQRKEWFGGYK